MLTQSQMVVGALGEIISNVSEKVRKLGYIDPAESKRYRPLITVAGSLERLHGILRLHRF